MKIGLLGDIHIGARNDSDFFLNNTLENLKHYLGIFREKGITNVIQFGDVFDRRKYVNFGTLHRFREEFLGQFRDFDVTCLVGNHDSYFKNTLKVNSLSCLLGEYRNIRIVSEPTEMKFGDTGFLMLPWITPDNKNRSIDLIQNSRCGVLCGHLEIKDIVSGHEFSEGMLSREFDRFSLVLSGHYHNSVNSGTVRYLGSSSELTWTDCGTQKSAFILDTDNMNIESYQQISPVFKKIYYSDEMELSVAEDPEYQNKICRLYIPEFDAINRQKFEVFSEILGKNAYSVECVEGSTAFAVERQNPEDLGEILPVMDLVSVHLDNAIQDQRIKDKNAISEYVEDLYRSALDRILEGSFND